MDISDFRTVIAVTETGSITAAARLLCRVPSAITTRVQNLEHHLGVMLFIKTGRRFIPTTAGLALYENALKIVELVATAEQQAAKPQPGGRFRVGALDSMAATRLPGPLSALYRKHHDVAVELVTGISRMLYEAVVNHELDAAFIADAPANDRLERMAVFEEELVIIAPANSPPIRAAGDLENATLLVFRDGCSYRDRLTVWLQQAQVKPYRLAEMSSYHAILGGVSAGMGVGIVPRPILSTFPSENLITVHPFMEPGNPITTALVWRKDGMTANIRALIDILSSEAESVSDTQRSAES